MPHLSAPQDIEIKDFDYNLPDEKIAKYPLEARDASKLLVYKNGTIQESEFKKLSNFIPEESLLIFNQTKVINARLLFHKITGAKIEVFCLEPSAEYKTVEVAMCQKAQVFWKCMIGGANKWKDDSAILLEIPNSNLKVEATKVKQEGGVYILKMQWFSLDGKDDSKSEISFAEVLHLAGKVPLPPYLNRNADASDEERYQTIFAKEEGSVAAPTAALHFTNEVLESFKTKNIQTNFVTLHVGAGTFKPVKSTTMAGHEMHAEWIEVEPSLINCVLTQLHNRKPIIAVGTTSARTLESLYWLGVKIIEQLPIDWQHIAIAQWDPYQINKDISVTDAFTALLQLVEKNKQGKIVTKTQIIIAPGYSYKVLDGIVTNFHQPQSTLLLLVSAMIGNDWKQVYSHALSNEFRFLSYGDSSLLWKNKEQNVKI